MYMLSLIFAGVGISLVLVESRIVSPLRRLFGLEGRLCLECVSWWSGLFLGWISGESFLGGMITAFGSHFLAVFLKSVRMDWTDVREEERK